MRMRKQDSNGDILFGNQEKDYHIDNHSMVAQNVLQRLRMWVGEWFLDLEAGTPWPAVLGKRKFDALEPMIRQRVKQTYGVDSIEYINIVNNPENRTVSIVLSLMTIYGRVNVKGQIQ